MTQYLLHRPRPGSPAEGSGTGDPAQLPVRVSQALGVAVASKDSLAELLARAPLVGVARRDASLVRLLLRDLRVVAVW